MKHLILDTETSGLHYMKDKAFLCGLKPSGWSPYYVDIRSDGIERISNEIKKCDLIVGHNLKFDLHMLVQAGIPWYLMKDKMFYDTMIAEAILDEHRYSYSLDALGASYLDIRKIDIVNQINERLGMNLSKDKAMRHLEKMPRKWVGEYCLRDVEITESIYKIQRENIKNFSVFSLEMKVLPHLVEIERRGVPVNEQGLVEAKQNYENKIKKLQRKLKVNVSSPLEMRDKFQELGIPLVINPETGNPTFSKLALKDNPHPFIQDVLRLRGYRKLKEGFLSRMQEHIVNGNLYTNFHQTRGDEYGTISGRLSSSGPNMQQVPKRQGEAFKVMRSLYHAPEGMTWLCGDWSQFEFRIFAHYSEDNKLWQAYQDDPDIDYHQLVADMAGIDRRTAKTINLGLSFGMGENRLAKELGMDKEDAQELFKKYHEKFPKIKKFLNFASARGARRGYVKTLLGRRIRFPDKNKTYKAGALIFQGSAADVMKKKIIELNSNIDGLRLIVHDEFNFIVPSETGRETLKKLKEIMEHVPELNVPVRASVNSGKNWWEAS